MAGRIADLALRRPWALLAACAGFLALATGLAFGAPDSLGIGSLRLSEPPGGASEGGELVIVIEDPRGSDPKVARVARRVIVAQVEADPAVEQASLTRGRGKLPDLVRVALGDIPADERQSAVRRLEEGIDPGPLRVLVGGEVATMLAARDELADELWRLGLLTLPAIALAVGATGGIRLALGTALVAAIALAGSIAGLRLAGVGGDLSLLGAGPAVAVGLVLGIELPAALARRYRDEAVMAGPAAALRRALDDGAPAVLAAALAASLPALGLVATPLEQAGSLALGTALAAWLAAAAALLVAPAVLSLGERREPRARRRSTERRGGHESTAGEEPEEGSALGALAGAAGRSRLAAALALGLAAVALVALAAPALDGLSEPFPAADLERSAEARRAAAAIPGPAAGTAPGDSLFAELPLAAALAAGALGLMLVVVTRSPWMLLAGPLSLLPAAAGIGVAVLVFQQGHLAEEVGAHAREALDTGAVAIGACAVAAVAAARSALALGALRTERRAGVSAEGAAELSGGLTLPGALTGTLAGGAAAGVLLASDYYALRELGMLVAAGLVADLLLARVPLLAAASRRLSAPRPPRPAASDH